MKISFYGSSILSSYWNGAATYYRGLLRELARRGHAITFYEPDAYDRQSHRDIDPPSWAKVVVYPATLEAARQVASEGADADVIVKASGIGVFDDFLLEATLTAANPHSMRIFWDVDAPATIAEIRLASDHPLRRALPTLDLVLTYGGGPPIVAAYEALGARRCVPIYNGVDPETHHPTMPDSRFECDLAFLGNRLPDREQRVAAFFFAPAVRAPCRRFVIGGSGWEQRALPSNVRHVGHVYTRDHNAFNTTPRAVLNIARDSMADIGFSPATRVFEAAGAAACIITDAWDGIELFLKPDEEILVARDAKDVSEFLDQLPIERARAIGAAARRRVLAEHTYEKRASQVDTVLREAALIKNEVVIA